MSEVSQAKKGPETQIQEAPTATPDAKRGVTGRISDAARSMVEYIRNISKKTMDPTAALRGIATETFVTPLPDTDRADQKNTSHTESTASQGERQIAAKQAMEASTSIPELPAPRFGLVAQEILMAGATDVTEQEKRKKFIMDVENAGKARANQSLQNEKNRGGSGAQAIAEAKFFGVELPEEQQTEIRKRIPDYFQRNSDQLGQPDIDSDRIAASLIGDLRNLKQYDRETYISLRGNTELMGKLTAHLESKLAQLDPNEPDKAKRFDNVKLAASTLAVMKDVLGRDIEDNAAYKGYADSMHADFQRYISDPSRGFSDHASNLLSVVGDKASEEDKKILRDALVQKKGNELAQAPEHSARYSNGAADFVATQLLIAAEKMQQLAPAEKKLVGIRTTTLESSSSEQAVPANPVTEAAVPQEDPELAEHEKRWDEYVKNFPVQAEASDLPAVRAALERQKQRQAATGEKNQRADALKKAGEDFDALFEEDKPKDELPKAA